MDKVSGANFFASAAYSIQSLSVIPRFSFTINFLKLSATELNRIYTALPSRIARTGTSASGTGTIATYTTTVAHGYLPGMLVSASGFTPAGFNATNARILSVPTPTTYTTSNATVGSSTVSGTVTPATMTLTVTGNWGTATDDPTIATTKGWSVTG
jgi:hypothetical protein